MTAKQRSSSSGGGCLAPLLAIGLLLGVPALLATWWCASKFFDRLPPAAAARPTVTYSGIPFVSIEPGSGSLGSPVDEPGHEPTLEAQRQLPPLEPFALSIHEISQGQYWAVVDPTHVVAARNRDLPMTELSWAEAVDFCQLLSAQHPACRFRLPTEAEWEYACRANSPDMFAVWRGDPADSIRRWHEGDQRRLERRARSVMNVDSAGLARVGQFPANDFGLYDMHGNASEWCALSSAGPNDAPSPLHRPIRGGAWTSVTCLDCRSAKRAWQRKDAPKGSIGFRVLLEHPQAAGVHLAADVSAQQRG